MGIHIISNERQCKWIGEGRELQVTKMTNDSVYKQRRDVLKNKRTREEENATTNFYASKERGDCRECENIREDISQEEE